MPKRIIPLSEIKVRKAKPKKIEYKIFDGGGLFLLVTPSGGKLWRFRYPFEKKEKKLSFGAYPAISLFDARKRRDEARSQLAHGIDPSAVRKAQKKANTESTNTFEIIARVWHAQEKSGWTAGHASTIMDRMERDIFPWIGKCHIAEIKPPEVLAVLRRVESRGALESAHRIKTICGQVFRCAVHEGWVERDPTADLKGALRQPQEKHRAAITEPSKVGELLRSIDGYQGSFIVKCALKLAPLVFVRPGELRHGEWEQVSFENAEWNIPASKMKMKEPNLVPLS